MKTVTKNNPTQKDFKVNAKGDAFISQRKTAEL